MHFYKDDYQFISIHALREEGDSSQESCFTAQTYFYPRPPRGGRPHNVNTSLLIINFYPRPPRGGRPDYTGKSVQEVQFLSTPSARRATYKCSYRSIDSYISIHALREEGDCIQAFPPAAHQNFYPRPPRGGRRETICHAQDRSSISIHALREEGDLANLGEQAVLNQISIHALREEGDRPSPERLRLPLNFYPRPPRGGRPKLYVMHKTTRQFLSTPSARRATGFGAQTPSGGYDFYPRPPRGGRPNLQHLSIVFFEFLSTPSARRATAKTETKSLFSNKLYNILHEFRRALIYNGSKNYPNHAKRLENPVRRCRKDAEDSPFAPGRKTQNNSRPSCSKGG